MSDIAKRAAAAAAVAAVFLLSLTAILVIVPGSSRFVRASRGGHESTRGSAVSHTTPWDHS